MSLSARIDHLFHYPIKGLSAQPLRAVPLEEGKGFPFDRVFGFARPDSGFDPENPRPLPKTKFVMLARDAKLALLGTYFETEDDMLEVTHDGAVERFNIATEAGRTAAARAVARTLDYAEADQPTLVAATPHRFTDVSVVSPEMMNAISLINADSVAAFGEKIGKTVSPDRFRGNIVFSGLAPFAELDMVGQTARIGDAEIRFVLRTKRCPATQVNLDTGERDLDVPKLLHAHYGHSDMGIYAEVITGGRISIGDAITF